MSPYISISAAFFIIISIFLFSLSLAILGNMPWGERFENHSFVWNRKHIFIIIIFFIIGASRPVIQDTDNASYVEFYQYIKYFGELPVYLQRKETGYAILNILFAKVFNLPYYIFFGFLTALTWGVYTISSYRYQFLLPWMLFFAICSGFLFWSFNGIRQSLAIVIFFYSIKFIIERKIIFYTLTLLVASLFHLSVLLLLPLYFLVGIRFNRNFWLIVYVSSLFLMASDFLNAAITKIFTQFFQLIPYFQSYEQYTVSDSFLVSRQASATDTGLGVILNVFITLFIIFFSNRTLIRFPSLSFYLFLFSFSAVISNLFFSIELIGRLLSYFLPLFSLLMAATIYSLNRKYSKLVFIIFFIIYTLLFIKLTIDSFG